MFDVGLYQKILGDELRRARKRAGLTRLQLRNRLVASDVDISVQTLATYELATRHCTVVRLAELCQALDQLPEELLTRVRHRLFAGDRLVIPLGRIVETRHPDLLPLRRWAEVVVAGGMDAVRFDVDMLDRMAELCGLDVRALVRHLHPLQA
ncbi:helix-turn-helix domain-containing protein [Amycolatopsis thailandensis]|uniref:helix-turn-helix domain-containing protein n=1 Tax=Amycolatopsis thailandensis TaxID=589330 RepID=UPI003637AD38